MALLKQSSPEFVGLNTSIVNALKEYGRIPIRLLSRITDRRIVEVEAAIDRLQKVGIVVIESDTVALAKKSGTHSDSGQTSPVEEEWLLRA